MRAAVRCLALLLLCHQAYSQDVIDVATAEELQQQLEAGTKHIRLTDHIYGSGAAPQHTWRDGASALFAVGAQTATITGACTERPPGRELAAEWRQGMCYVHVPDTSGFLIMGPADVFWMDNLYVYMTRSGSANNMQREAIAVILDRHGGSLYFTNVSIEVVPLSDDSPALWDPFTAWGELGRFEMLFAGASIAANDVNTQSLGADGASKLSYFGASNGASMPDNATVNLINSTWLTLGSKRPVFVWFATDLRIERCAFQGAFAAVPAAAGTDVRFDGTDEVVTRYLYTDDATIRIDNRQTNEEAEKVQELPLALATTEERLARGLSPFLTLEDVQLLGLQAEVLGRPLSLSPPPSAVQAPASAPQPAGSADTAASTTEKSPSRLKVGEIVGAVLGGLLALLLAALAGFLWRDRNHAHQHHHGHRTATASETLQASKEGAKTSSGSGSVAQSSADNMIAICRPQADFVTMTQWDGDPTARAVLPATPVSPISPFSKRHGPSSAWPACDAGTPAVSPTQRFVTMSMFNTHTPDASIRMVTMSSRAGDTDTHGRTLSHAQSCKRLGHALDVMHARGEPLMGRWEILNAEQRRVGGQGIVQFIKDLDSGEELVCKFFLDPVAFYREAELYHQAHVREMMAAIVDVQDNALGRLTVADGVVLPPFIVLEKGRSLNEWAMITLPDFPTSLQVLSQIVDRLRALHALRLVHRDIKPANVLWRSTMGQWTLIDFGCCVSAGSESTIACSIRYSPPEVALALKEKRPTMRAETSADIWSLGVVIYELLTGYRAFGTGQTAEDIIGLLTSPEPLPWEAGHPRASQLGKLGMLKKIVKVCLDRDPLRRPTADELLGTLNNLFYTTTKLAQTHASAASETSQTICNRSRTW